MEYMLLKDGTVKFFDCLGMSYQVLDALADYDGVAYYWCNTAFNWCCILPSHDNLSPTTINESEVPEIILLAHMLE